MNGEVLSEILAFFLKEVATTLRFSDAAKYADVARSIVEGQGFSTNFTFFLGNNFTAQWIPPFMPFSITGFFGIFGVSDLAVIGTSFFFFLFTLVFVYLLSIKLFGNKLTAWLSTAAVGFSYDLIHYASTGASESPFIFEIVAATYFVALKKKWGDMVALLLLVLMYFTRPQAFIYIAGIVFYWLLTNIKAKKAWIYFGLVLIVGVLIDRFVLSGLSGKYFLYSITDRGSNVLSQVGVGQSASDQLRSGVLTYGFSIVDSFKKVFYNLYNFYKLLPQIINPYLFLLFVVGLFTSGYRELKHSALFMVAITFLVTAASIPFFRYIHPIIPIVYILAVGTLYEIISKTVSNTRKQNIVVTLLILIFGVGQTLGVIFLDSRYERNTHNVGKPPVYVQLSYVLRDNTEENQVIVTNLDTWGSWYGERKTVWFPLEPKQLVDSTGNVPFDAIYLTSYLIDDPNYYMGESWRTIFENPENKLKWVCDGCDVLSREFELKGIFKVDASENYERQDANAILLVKND